MQYLFLLFHIYLKNYFLKNRQYVICCKFNNILDYQILKILFLLILSLLTDRYSSAISSCYILNTSSLNTVACHSGVSMALPPKNRFDPLIA